jgi:peroxiredoxin
MTTFDKSNKMGDTLAAKLQATEAAVYGTAPTAAKETLYKSIDSISNTFDTSAVIQVGDKLPAFKLPNAVGKEVTSESLIASAQKGVLITLYRGEWCPYCNLALSHLQKHYDDFTARGITLVAISPELPNNSLTMAEKHALRFETLSDVGNAYARELKIIWKQSGELVDLLDKFGIDMNARNGNSTGEIPVPTTLLVDKFGNVRNTFMSPNWTKRLETSVALEWADKL